MCCTPHPICIYSHEVDDLTNVCSCFWLIGFCFIIPVLCFCFPYMMRINMETSRHAIERKSVPLASESVFLFATSFCPSLSTIPEKSFLLSALSYIIAINSDLIRVAARRPSQRCWTSVWPFIRVQKNARKANMYALERSSGVDPFSIASRILLLAGHHYQLTELYTTAGGVTCLRK